MLRLTEETLCILLSCNLNIVALSLAKSLLFEDVYKLIYTSFKVIYTDSAVFTSFLVSASSDQPFHN